MPAIPPTQNEEKEPEVELYSTTKIVARKTVILAAAAKAKKKVQKEAPVTAKAAGKAKTTRSQKKKARKKNMIKVTATDTSTKHPFLHRTVAFHVDGKKKPCLLYTSPSPRDQRGSRMPSSA